MGTRPSSLFAICFLISIVSFVPHSTCWEEKYYTVGMDTFRFKQDNRGRSLSESNARGRRLNVELTHLDPTINGSWRHAWLQRMEKDNVRVNYILALAGPILAPGFNSSLISVIGQRGGVRIKSHGEFQAPGYGIKVKVGKPPRKQLMTIDSITALSRVYCNPCSDCASPKLPMFEPRRSSSFQTVSCKLSKCPPLGADPRDVPSACDNWGVCTYSMTFSEGQVSCGDFIKEFVRVGSNKLKDVTMACMYQNTKPRFDGPSGVLGLGRGALSIVSQKYGGQFSYCLPDYTSASATGSLRLGRSSIPRSVKMFTPMEKVDDFLSSAYIVGLEGISVGGQRLNVNLQQPVVPRSPIPITVINCGVMATRLVKPAYQALKDSFVEKMMGVKRVQPFGIFDPCYQLPNPESVKLPSITFHFKGNVNVDVRDIGTLVQVSETVACLAFAASESDSVNFIGDVQQQRIRVAFDNVYQKIGFAPEDC